MNEPAPGQPWAFIAHKDGHWAGLCAADNSASAGTFVARFVNDGFAITTVYSRDEYNSALASMKSWHEHPDYRTKKRAAALNPQDRGGSNG